MPNPITINESNITLTFPNEEQVFRFQDCQGYTTESLRNGCLRNYLV